MFDNFPGLLGYSGIIGIHADWPIYPTGAGWKVALKTIGNFPFGTEFYQIDDIDKCKLLLNQNPEQLTDCFDYKHYHSAVWHEDLIELKNKGYIVGVDAVSEFEFDMIKFERFKSELGRNLQEDEEGNIILHSMDEKGKSKELIYYKPLRPSDDDEWEFNEFAIISNTITLTSKGLTKLSELANDFIYCDEFKDLVEPFIKIRRYDTAVREASLLLETTIKGFHNETLFGQQLIDFHIKDLIKQNHGFFSAAIKCYRGELRTIFKFIRNDFAHNFKILSEEQCRLILNRINETYIEFKEVKKVYYS
ncbi:hypothetical protein [Pontibacter pamirensis]|uniref:hypothetical protein n=1 Tax=Pontibacter pamirensis TaxID=2562824 RepID=UPI0013896F51|nr:hypothetical protein [Pontibacter pamirensis]